jgi:LAO/AO transport system kinase
MQGIKRGIMEVADLIVVNKADGAFADDAARVAQDYKFVFISFFNFQDI